mmetsp:Transcript_32694/g.28956  ORF Transcript_32694/g.28956 Transcript_32694/m.28956 type:complete len:211 (-) Transcript_32694:113-745(-)
MKFKRFARNLAMSEIKDDINESNLGDSTFNKTNLVKNKQKFEYEEKKTSTKIVQEYQSKELQEETKLEGKGLIEDQKLEIEEKEQVKIDAVNEIDADKDNLSKSDNEDTEQIKDSPLKVHEEEQHKDNEEDPTKSQEDNLLKTDEEILSNADIQKLNLGENEPKDEKETIPENAQKSITRDDERRIDAKEEESSFSDAQLKVLIDGSHSF